MCVGGRGWVYYIVGSLYFNFTPKTLSVLTGIASNSLSTHKIRKVNKINK